MLIEFDQAIVATPQTTVLRGVSVALAGRRVGIVGPNGAGKSTLARLVNGLVPVSYTHLDVYKRQAVGGVGVHAQLGRQALELGLSLIHI